MASTQLQNLKPKYQLLVIGGGINGAGIALDAALRGLDVLLVEKGDFGSGSSSGCFRIAHGGLRYLQHFDFFRLFESVREQRYLRKNAPHLLAPLKILVPCYGWGKRGKPYLGLGVFLYHLITFWKNIGVQSKLRLPRPFFLTRERVQEILPGIHSTGLRGAVVFYDCQILNCDRLTSAVVHSAKNAGAEVLSYTKASDFSVSNGSIRSIELSDVETKEKREIVADYFVNAAGPWISETLNITKPESSKEKVFSKGIQLTLEAAEQNKEFAIALESEHFDPSAKVSRGGRSYFVVPWRGKILAGTADSRFEGRPDDYKISATEVKHFSAEMEVILGRKISLENEFINSFGGLRPIDPLVEDESGEAAPVARTHRIVDHTFEGINNILSVEGVKYTTYRSLAEKVTDLVLGKISKTKSNFCPCETQQYPLGWAGKAVDPILFKQLQQLVGDSQAERLRIDFGAGIKELLPLLEKDSGLIGEDSCFTKAEIRFICRNEICLHFSDLVLRRMPVYASGGISSSSLESALEVFAEEKSLEASDLLREQEILAIELSRFVYQ